LTLIISNTVKMAQHIFRSVPEDGPPKILLTSRFRACDRRTAEQQLSAFEARRSKSPNGNIDGDPGLICASTQVVEAGLDISAHRLWSELAPWASVIQRLGRLNRDGRDEDAIGYFWKTPNPEKQKRDGENWIGPYRDKDLMEAETLLEALRESSKQMPFTHALEGVRAKHASLLDQVLQPRLEPHPRALDVHGLFSTESDLFGGFTDVSRFVRNGDPDADLAVFWRTWDGPAPPEGDALDGPPFDPDAEACPIAAQPLQEFLKVIRARAWLWNDRTERWDATPAGDLRPGMTVMLHGDLGGYSKRLGWTGESGDRLGDLPAPGRGRALRDDLRAEAGHWCTVASHLSDARGEAERLCDTLGLDDRDPKLRLIRKSVVEAAGLHDIGKAHPVWRGAVPKGGPFDHEAVAKFPKVLRVATLSRDAETVRATVAPHLASACPLPDEIVEKDGSVCLRWALARGLNRDILENIRALPCVRSAAHKAFRPGMRHEAASALAMWRQLKNSNKVPYPALAIYLVAAHHGKVRTVLRAITREGGDVFGVRRSPEAFQFDGRDWPMDFSVAIDGAEGDWTGDGFVLADHGWTGLVADLLGSWRGEVWVGAVPKDEPRALGPFALAWLEALVRVADWRASDNPSHFVRPGDCVG
jgi:CRISPR-associated endonuclease/helicase Cas3